MWGIWNVCVGVCFPKCSKLSRTFETQALGLIFTKVSHPVFSQLLTSQHRASQWVSRDSKLTQIPPHLGFAIRHQSTDPLHHQKLCISWLETRGKK